jgi:hypothetical protein
MPTPHMPTLGVTLAIVLVIFLGYHVFVARR